MTRHESKWALARLSPSPAIALENTYLILYCYLNSHLSPQAFRSNNVYTVSYHGITVERVIISVK